MHFIETKKRKEKKINDLPSPTQKEGGKYL